MLIQESRIQAIIKALHRKYVTDLTPEFDKIWDERSTSEIVNDLHRKDHQRGRSHETVRVSTVGGAFGEASIAQLLTQAGFKVGYGCPTDYGFDLIVEFPEGDVKIEVKKQHEMNTFVVFNHPAKYLNVEHTAANNSFDLMVCWRLINGRVMMWAALSNEVFSSSNWVRCHQPTKDFEANKFLLDPAGNKIFGKFIKDGLATSAGHFAWLDR